MQTVEEGFVLIDGQQRHHSSQHTVRSKISDKRDCVTVSTLGIYSRKNSREKQDGFYFNREEREEEQKEEETKEYTDALIEENKEDSANLLES